MKPNNLIFLINWTVAVIASDQTCDKDDLQCHERTANSIVDLNQRLLDIAQLQKANINRAYDEIRSLSLNHKEEPRVLYLLSKIQMAMYTKLHVKMREVGRLELLYPSIDNLKAILRMPRELVSDRFHAEVSEFSTDSAIASTNKTLSVELLEAVLERAGNKEITYEKYKEYFELLIEEYYFAKLFDKSVELLDKVRQMFGESSIEQKFLHALIQRYNEVANNKPFVVSHDLLKKVRPKTDDDKRELIFYIQDLEKELRRQKRNTEVDIMYEISEELELYPSKYQRPNMLLDGLRAQPIWSMEDSGYEAELQKIVDSWPKIRPEFLNLTEQLEDWEWRESANFDKFDTYNFLGDGVTELPETGCSTASTFCDIAKTFNIITECVLCEMKLLFFEPKAHYRPFVGATNAKLTALFPVSSANTTELNHNGLSSFKVRIADQTVEWQENKPAIIDMSFEHEIWNQSIGPRMILMIDFKHPDMSPEEDFLDPKHWDISNVDGNFVYQMKQESF